LDRSPITRVGQNIGNTMLVRGYTFESRLPGFERCKVCPPRGCSQLAALATAKIRWRRPAFHFDTGSKSDLITVNPTRSERIGNVPSTDSSIRSERIRLNPTRSHLGTCSNSEYFPSSSDQLRFLRVEVAHGTNSTNRTLYGRVRSPCGTGSNRIKPVARRAVGRANPFLDSPGCGFIIRAPFGPWFFEIENET
jgi:hypothetical protein